MMRYFLASAAVAAILAASAAAQTAKTPAPAMQQDNAATTPTVQDHAISTKGTGCTRASDSTSTAGRTSATTQTPVDPKNPQCALKTRTKSNNSNE